MINYVGGGGNGSLRVGQGMISDDGRPKWLRKNNDHATPKPNPPHPPIHLSTHPLTLGWSEPCDTRKKMCGTWNDCGPRQPGAEERQEAKRVGQGLISIEGRSGRGKHIKQERQTMPLQRPTLPIHPSTHPPGHPLSLGAIAMERFQKYPVGTLLRLH